MPKKPVSKQLQTHRVETRAIDPKRGEQSGRVLRTLIEIGSLKWVVTMAEQPGRTESTRGEHTPHSIVTTVQKVVPGNELPQPKAYPRSPAKPADRLYFVDEPHLPTPAEAAVLYVEGPEMYVRAPIESRHLALAAGMAALKIIAKPE